MPLTHIAVSPTLDSAVRRLSAYGVKMRDWPLVWEEIGTAFAQAELELFQTEGAQHGGSNTPWAQLKDSTLESKSKLWPGTTILVASGELEASLTEKDRAMHVLGPDVMLWRSDVTTPDGRWNLAALHYTGTRYMVPRNPIINIRYQRELARVAVEKLVIYP